MKNFKILLLIFLNPILILSQPLMHPYNLDFEEGEAGKLPRGWSMPSYAVNLGYDAGLTEYNSKSGKYNLELRRYKEFKDNIYGSVMQSIDASEFRGKTIKFGAWLRAEIDGPKGSAHLWIIEYLPDDDVGFYDMMEENPVVVNEWKYYELSLYVNENAQYLNFGMMLKGNGRAWMDEAKIEVLDKPRTYTPGRTISKLEKKNLFAFAKLYGNVRYFNPSTEAMSVDWDKFAYTGIKNIIQSANDDALISDLLNIFQPVAPALKIFKEKLAPEEYYYIQKPKEAIERSAVAWLHTGSPTLKETKLTSSKPVNIYVSQRKSEGVVIQTLDAEQISGKRIKFRIYAKENLIKPSGVAEIRLFPEFGERKEDILNSVNNMALTSISGSKWKDYDLELNFPIGAKSLRLGLVLVGDGEVWFDDAKLFIKNGEDWKEIELRNSGFEDGTKGKLTRGWRLLPISEQGGYYAEVTDKDKHSGALSLKINSDTFSRIVMPEPGEVILGDLTDNLKFSMPICMYVDSSGTLPHSKKELYKIPDDTQVSGNDLYGRLAIFIQAWNIFNQFGIYNQENDQWNKVFNELIEKAASDKGEWDFLQTLKILSANLNDGFARVWHGEENLSYTIPFLIKSVGNDLVIGNVNPNYKDVEAGDKIISINGKKVNDYLLEAAKHISSESDGWRKVRAIAELRAGKENSFVKLKIQSMDGSEKELEVHRTTYINDVTDVRLPSAAQINKDIFYIDLTRVDDKELKYLSEQLKTSKYLIFDLRGNVNVSEHFLGLLLKENIKSIEWDIPIYTKPDAKATSFYQIFAEIKAKSSLSHITPIFLQDERSIGYSEAILAIVQKYDIGKTVGRNTAGTVGEVSGFKLQGGYGFSWSTIIAKGFDKSYIRGGIKPDVNVENTREGIKQNRDEILEKAMDLIETLEKGK